MTRKNYDEGHKEDAYILRRRGLTMAQISKTLGIPINTLYKWGVQHK